MLDESLTLRRRRPGMGYHRAYGARGELGGEVPAPGTTELTRKQPERRRRSAFVAKLMLEPADVLLLDEPTNDLDIRCSDPENLLEFPGALVLVTHDRYLLNRVVSTVLGLDGCGNTGVCGLWSVRDMADNSLF
jgi:ATPase subunit of ABC transporter with duplicated ATPase domains